MQSLEKSLTELAGLTGQQSAEVSAAQLLAQAQAYAAAVWGSGTATILNGNTSVVVTHGLAVTPTLADISVVAGEDPTNSVGLIWVDTITATQFTIHCEADPGASNLDLGWRVVVL